MSIHPVLDGYTRDGILAILDEEVDDDLLREALGPQERILCPFCRFTEWFYWTVDDFISKVEWSFWCFLAVPIWFCAYLSTEAMATYIAGFIMGMLFFLLESMKPKAVKG